MSSKDYFWIIDMHPNMIMHPYRPELVDSDLNDYKDPRWQIGFCGICEYSFRSRGRIHRLYVAMER